MSKTITDAMPIRTVGLTPGHRWCGRLRSVKPAVNNGKGAHGLVHGPNSLNATFIRQGRISVRLRKLARNLRNGHLHCDRAIRCAAYAFDAALTIATGRSGKAVVSVASQGRP